MNMCSVYSTFLKKISPINAFVLQQDFPLSVFKILHFTTILEISDLCNWIQGTEEV